MNQHNISDSSLLLSLFFIVIALSISYREKLGISKDIFWSVLRAVIQLLVVGYLLKSIFDLNNKTLTILMVFFICLNAALNAFKYGRKIDGAMIISFLAITSGTVLTLTILVLSGAIEFIPTQIIPISGMIAGNAMIAVGLCFSNINQRFSDNRQKILEMLSLGASSKIASAHFIRESIRASMTPTIDAAKTVGIVSLPGMMSGLIFAGIDPMKAIKYQIMVTFMLIGTASISTIITAYLSLQKIFTKNAQINFD